LRPHRAPVPRLRKPRLQHVGREHGGCGDGGREHGGRCLGDREPSGREHSVLKPGNRGTSAVGTTAGARAVADPKVASPAATAAASAGTAAATRAVVVGQRGCAGAHGLGHGCRVHGGREHVRCGYGSRGDGDRSADPEGVAAASGTALTGRTTGMAAAAMSTAYTPVSAWPLREQWSRARNRRRCRRRPRARWMLR
jgi:hypothetical protein